MFGRRKIDVEITDADVESFVDDLTPEERAEEDADLEQELLLAEAGERPADVQHPQGPWDLADAPDTDRLDLGALQVVAGADVEVRLEVSPEGQVVAVTLAHGESAVQVNVFAAPRSEGIWAEVRAEIAEALKGGGGQALEADGPFGTELRAIVPNEVPGQGVVRAPARFVGVDGPRWFLRALFSGPAATQDGAAAPLYDALRQVVVVRGTDPMPAREPLPIVLPLEAQAQAQAAAEAVAEAEQEAEAPRITLPERGPEITEVR